MKVISILNISKQYRLGTISSGRLTDDITSFFYQLLKKENPIQKVAIKNDLEMMHRSKNIWALKNISFNLNKGEILGIIGKNGSGKSTLLKIISRITSPSEGSIKIYGKVSSLLEVGTGFHPELTGRENIFLNGAMMGLKRIEINDRIDEIIKYSGIGAYIDTPIKRYSSGMGVRLGFSVAAHLNPDILIIDEVLAVGDVAFKKKAINTMRDFIRSKNKTIIFVSHDTELIKMLCSRSIVLEQGEIIFDGNKLDAIKLYNHICNKKVKRNYENISKVRFKEKTNNLDFFLTSMSLKNEYNQLCNSFTIKENLFIELNFTIKKTNPGLMVNMQVLEDDVILFNTHLNDKNLFTEDIIEEGQYITITKIPKLFLPGGVYQIRCSMGIINNPNGYTPSSGIKFFINDNLNNLELTSFMSTRSGKILFNEPWVIKNKKSLK